MLDLTNIKITLIISIFSLLNIMFFIFCFTDKANYKTKKYNFTIDNYKYNIFFVETNSEREIFSARQLCAIESAALNNPLALVNVYSLKAKLNKKYLERYKNIRVIEPDLEDLFNETILEKWFKFNANKINNSPHKYILLSDIIRLVLLWKFGGYYSDLDTITIKSIEPLLKYNGASLCQDNPIEINNSNLLFSKNHTFLFKLMKLSVENFNPNEAGSIGQYYFWQNVEKICNIKINKIPKVEIENLNNLNDELPCDFYFFPTKYFSPFNWNLFEKYFIKDSKIEISKFLEAYSIHFFSSHSKKSEVKFRSNTIFEFYAKNNCPFFYQENLIGNIDYNFLFN